MFGKADDVAARFSNEQLICSVERRPPLLTLLFEQPMHGYQVVSELERREVSDWAGSSRPQVYYSLNKLAARALVEPTGDHELSAGPERCTCVPTTAAMSVVAEALARDDWAPQRPPPPFVTWVALSGHARRRIAQSMVSFQIRTFEAELEWLDELTELLLP